MKILFRSKAGDHKEGDRIYLKGYKRPFRVIQVTNELIKVRHSITGCIMRLSPGWPCLHENEETCEVLGLINNS